MNVNKTKEGWGLGGGGKISKTTTTSAAAAAAKKKREKTKLIRMNNDWLLFVCVYRGNFPLRILTSSIYLPAEPSK